jgi:hypothetical protein
MKQRRNGDRRPKIKMNLCAKPKTNRSGTIRLPAKAFKTSSFANSFWFFMSGFLLTDQNVPSSSEGFCRFNVCRNVNVYKNSMKVRVSIHYKFALTQFSLRGGFGPDPTTWRLGIQNNVFITSWA